MLSSMYAGVSGLKVHQTKLDVIGNNIANVNTVAYKQSVISFKEVFSRTLAGAQAPAEGGLGGVSPSQVGLGTGIGGITTIHTRGSIQPTGNPYDLAIEGAGYFVVSDGIGYKYTRAGNFTVDTHGNLVASGGEKVLGWNKRPGEEVHAGRPLEPINLSNLFIPAKATDKIVFEGNLDSRIEPYEPANPVTGEPEKNVVEYNMTIYDSLGDSHTLLFKFKKSAPGTFSYSVSSLEPGMNILQGAEGGSIIFDNEGRIHSKNIPGLSISFTTGAANINITPADLVFDQNKFTQFSNEVGLFGIQNGYEPGTLDSIGIDREGKVMGKFTNGRSDHIGTIALATFTNPSGLEKVGNSLFGVTWNSGDAVIGMAGGAGKGIIASNALEMSNVDLSKEFTEMIVAQRGFQANSKILTTADEILQELVNLKR